MPPKLNKEWHEANRMPKNPTPTQRFTWHLEHEKACACRAISPKLREQITAWQGKA
jgi:hypothetical protein